jgi:hypothetical protein
LCCLKITELGQEIFLATNEWWGGVPVLGFFRPRVSSLQRDSIGLSRILFYHLLFDLVVFVVVVELVSVDVVELVPLAVDGVELVPEEVVLDVEPESVVVPVVVVFDVVGVSLVDAIEPADVGTALNG